MFLENEHASNLRALLDIRANIVVTSVSSWEPESISPLSRRQGKPIDDFLIKTLFAFCLFL